MKESQLKHSVPTSVKIKAADRNDLDSQVEHAVNLLIARAVARGVGGILVTRHSAVELTVELDDRVPYGVTYERQEW